MDWLSPRHDGCDVCGRHPAGAAFGGLYQHEVIVLRAYVHAARFGQGEQRVAGARGRYSNRGRGHDDDGCVHGGPQCHGIGRGRRGQQDADGAAAANLRRCTPYLRRASSATPAVRKPARPSQARICGSTPGATRANVPRESGGSREACEGGADWRRCRDRRGRVSVRARS